MDFKSSIDRECVLLLGEKTKNEALIRMAEAAALASGIADRERLVKEILYREQLMSTGIGLGIAVPHVRFDQIQKPLIAVGVQPAGIGDYGSIDDQPVKIIVMILVGSNQHKEHIRLLSQVVAFLKSDGVIAELVAARSADDIFAAFREPRHE
jgi:PTS system nitrogen regulatory IIA component